MILKAILLGLVAMLGHTNFLFGTNLLDRPLIMCTLTGLVMGDLKSGIIIGAMMELAFIGAFSVGGITSTRYDFWRCAWSCFDTCSRK